MKKINLLTLMLAVLVMMMGVSAAYAQDSAEQASPEYVCGYYYQDGQRMNDCFGEKAEVLFGDADGINFVQQSEYYNRIGNYEAAISVPAVKGLADADAEKALNDHLLNVAYAIIDQFEADAREALSEATESDELPYFMTSLNFSVVTDTESVITLAVENVTTGASSYTTQSYFNFDKGARELMHMDDYFIAGTKAAEILKNEIERQMNAQMEADSEVVYWINEEDSEVELNWDDVLATVGNNNGYYIDENGDLVITFAKYEVAPGAMGNPKFVIPTDVVAAMDEALVQP